MLRSEELLASLQRKAKLPSVENFICILLKCREQKDFIYAKQVHSHVRDNGLESHPVLGNYLVPMLVECGCIVDAERVFHGLGHRNEYSWTSLIQGYVDYGESQHAIDLFCEFQEDHARLNKYTLQALLKACAKLKYGERGQELHVEITRKGIEKDLFVGSTLVDMYAKCGSLAEAQDVFDKLPVRDEVLWTALISGYTEHGLDEEALHCLEQMQVAGVFPDVVTFICSLKACGKLGAIDKAREIYTEIAKEGLERHPFFGSTLVDMYAKCGSLAEAQEVFNRLPVRNIVSWTALIGGYTEHGLGDKVLLCYEEMQVEGVFLDSVVFACLLKACASMGALHRGQQLHSEVVKQEFESDLSVSTTLVDMYIKCGSLVEAQEVFYDMSVRSVVSWNALIAGYTELGLGEDVLDSLNQMQLDGLSPDEVTYFCSLKACGSMGAINRGQQIHAEIAKQEYEGDSFVGNTMVDMYAKCGALAEAREVFEELPVQTVVAWSALISGYACQGEIELVFQLFERMREEGVQPNELTFLNVLTACNHAGLVDMGQKYFVTNSQEYSIIPTIEHHNCMIDLVGRAGLLNEAVMILDNMPIHPNFISWGVLLDACRKGGNLELGRHAFECTVGLDEKEAGAFILMSNFYADAHMWEGCERG